MLQLQDSLTAAVERLEFIERKAINKPVRKNAEKVRRELVDKGWRATYGAIFGQAFVDVLAEHHIASIECHWDARIAILNGRKPEYYADFPIFPRGHMKSGLARRLAVIDAVMSYAYETNSYCLYFSGTNDKTESHALTISQFLQRAEIRYWCPELATVKKSEVTDKELGWRAAFIYTQAGCVFHFGSLQSGLAGANVEDLRPTLLVPDDIDDRHDSEVESKAKMKLFTTEILPMGATGTFTYWAQNLISRYSCMYQVYKGKVKVLTNRRPSKPIKAVEDIEITYWTVGGIIRPCITGGRPTWPHMGIDGCQEELERFGPDAFMRECQHEVDQSKEGVILKNYNDSVHVISESEFASVYGALDEWRKWNKWMIHDWAQTKTDEHACVAAYVTVSNQNTAFPGAKFLFHPMAFKAAIQPEDIAERFLNCLSPYAYGTTTWMQLRKDELLRANAAAHTSTWDEEVAYKREVLARVIPRYSRPLLARFNVLSGAMSHDQKTTRKMFNRAFGFNMHPSNPGHWDSIETINDDMRIDFSEAHPFRPHQMGYSRWFIVVPDDPDGVPYLGRNARLVTPPPPYRDELTGVELFDGDLIRYQFSEWRIVEQKVTMMGETAETPFKGKDDFPQALQMLYHKKFMTNLEMTPEETFEEKMNIVHPELTRQAIDEAPEDRRSAKWTTRMAEQAEFERENGKLNVEKGLGGYVDAYQDENFDWMNEL